MASRIRKHWFLLFNLIYGAWVTLPFFAPIFMQIGWEKPGRVVYFIYSFFCHQLPQRSFFFFGDKFMYSLSEIQAAWENTIDPFILRKFIGSPGLGWKVAWSDRMISMYMSVLIFSWLWYILRNKVKLLSLWVFILLSIPMAVDGFSHLVSDFAGIGQGFRDSNLWLAELTNNAFKTTFYAGDSIGSFNSWMRLITGTLFGLGFVWFSFPYIDSIFKEITKLKEVSLSQAKEKLTSQITPQ